MDKNLINIIDLESTCWDKNSSDVPEGEVSEIIEIGITVLDLDALETTAKHSILVRPTRSRVSDFCTQLTTLTQAQVDAGISFEAACQQLRKEFHSDSRGWASWGFYDRNMFVQQCEIRQIHYPFSSRHLNLKEAFSKAIGSKKRFGMNQALERLGIPLEGTHHRGDDDAWNIAQIALRVPELLEELRGIA
jgi:inhibitor of KinA sporulation pathway (predicted exonuclease)